MISLIRRAAFSLAIGASMIAPAYADYGVTTEHDQVIVNAAKSKPAAPATDAQAKTMQQMYDYHGTYPPPSKAYAPAPLGAYATTGTSLPAPDLVGTGGAQDDMARQIHHPGSGTGW